MAAVALIVMEVETRSSGRSRRSSAMSSTLEIDTPTRPTSLRASGASASCPICVGRSKATDSPVCPSARR